MKNQTIKLQAFLAHAGIASRRTSEKLILEKKILVNNKTAHIGQRINPTKDVVKFEGNIISNTPKIRYFLINKPIGYVSTTSDEMGRKTVVSLLPKNVTERLYPVGRLDMESEGLMLLTNDGNLAQKLTHPKFKIKKTYHVTIKGTPTFKAINHLRNGVKLKDGFTKKAKVKILLKEEGETILEIIISEGRNRQIRRMLERVGYNTIKLVRVKMGSLDLEVLNNKQVMELSEYQVSKLTNME